MLLKRPYIFDIVISDFGRESAIEYLRSAAIIEKRIIHLQLRQPNVEFYDEYRRLMFVMVGDLAYFKKSQIQSYEDQVYLDSGILLGIRELTIPLDVQSRIQRNIIQQIYFAISKGYANIRVIIPCNTLSPLGFHIGELLANKERTYWSILNELQIRESPTLLTHLQETEFQVCTVPAIIFEEIRREHGSEAKLLILGTASTVQIYASEIEKSNGRLKYSVVQLSRAEQSLINEAIVASIDGDASVVRRMQQRIDAQIITPRRSASNHLVVIEACTDFDLGLGMNTLQVFVKRLVCDAYGIARQ